MNKRLLLSAAAAILLTALLAGCSLNHGPSVITDPPKNTDVDPADTGMTTSAETVTRDPDATEATDGDPTQAPVEQPTEARTEPSSEAATEAMTEVPTEVPTEASTEPATEPVSDDDPRETPVKVGVSYDGKTPCYDGRLRHGTETFKTSAADGTKGEYASLQDAIDALKGVGGSVSCESFGDVGLCLRAQVPEDGCFYRINYNYNNCDFVFDHGYTYDDGAGAYAYYSDLGPLDRLETLGETYLFVWGEHEELPAGCYIMHFVGGGNAEGGRNYTYELRGEVSAYWPGLPNGETYFKASPHNARLTP